MPQRPLDRTRTNARHARVLTKGRGRAVRVVASAACLTTAFMIAPAASLPDTWHPVAGDAAGQELAVGGIGSTAPSREVTSRGTPRTAPPVSDDGALPSEAPVSDAADAADAAGADRQDGKALADATPGDAPAGSAPRSGARSDQTLSGRPGTPVPVPAPDPTAPPAPSPTPDPPVTPAPAPPAQGSDGKPGPHNTGVPAGTSLRVHEGDLRIREAGAVIDGLDVRGFVFVEAPGVVVRRTVVRGGPTSSTKGLIHVSDPNASVVVEDSLLSPSTPSPHVNGLHGANITARRVDIRGVIDAAHLYGVGNVVIEDSWLHDNAHFAKDPNWNGGPSHDDSIQIQVGANIRIRNNTISGATGAAVQFTQDQGRVTDVQISGNWIDGGGCSINFSESNRGAFTGIAITDNVFGRNTKHESCAIIAPRSTLERLTVRGNVFTDGVTARVRTG